MILFRYVVKELIFPFSLSVGVISSILLMDQIYQFIPFLRTSGIEIKSLFLMILFSMPPVLMIATPISIMIGVYVGINRISNDYELVVIRTSGISLSFLYSPVIFVAFIVAVVVMLQAFYLAPKGITRLEDLKFSILKKQTRINLSVRRINNFFGQKLIFIFDKENDLFKGIFIADWNSPGSSGIIEAEYGKIYLDEKQHQIVFRLKEGRIHNFLNKSNYRIIEFDELDYNLRAISTERKDMPRRYRAGNKREKGRMNIELTSIELWDKISRSKPGSKQYLESVDEFHGRVVTVLSCLCFAIFSLSMAVYDPRNPKAGSIVYLIIMMITFFLIFVQMRALLLRGLVPFPALYSPVILVLAVGFFQYYRINYDLGSIKEMIVNRFSNRNKADISTL